MSEYRNWEKAIEGDEGLTKSFEHAAWIHRNALTVEDLHSKSEIVFELAWRDVRIAQLENEVMSTNRMLMCFIKDAFKPPTGRPSKKTAIKMMKYIAENNINTMEL